jgi:hypothetical protein
VIQQIKSIYPVTGNVSDIDSIDNSNQPQSQSQLIDIFQVLVLANERFLMIDKATLWNYDAVASPSHSSNSVEDLLNAKDQLFISSLYQDYCCLYLELLSTTLSSFYHEEEFKSNSTSYLLSS